ncbi:MAG TPA: branched-chain amino acid ABC transporter permease [Dehalococcoidia bacterium]|nr:branched-chain amino acid ABC transporter permease [Dehalococcoidia bacterium]
MGILRRRGLWLALLGLGLLVFPWLFNTYINYLASLIAVWVVVALGLNLLTGYTAQISLGHGALLAIGAYTAAIATTHAGLPYWVALLLAGAVTGLVGFLIGIPALRLEGPYLAIATLGLALSVPSLLLKYDRLQVLGLDLPFSGGVQGITARQEIGVPSFLSGTLAEDQWTYYFVIVVAAVMTVLAWNIVRSRTGRAFIALRDSEVAAQAMGVSLRRYKTMAFALSAFYTGIAGGLYVVLIKFVSPDSFLLLLSITFLTMIVVGGLGTITGSILGAAFITILEAMLSSILRLVPAILPPGFLPGLADNASGAVWLVYGAVLILVMIFMPSGLYGFVRRIARRVGRPIGPSPVARPRPDLGLDAGPPAD